MKLAHVLCFLALAACSASQMRASVTMYKPSSGSTPSIPLALSSGTAWYGDSNYTTIVPFNTLTHAFGKPIPDPTVIPYSHAVLENASANVLTGAPLAPNSLARDAGGNLWGVGYADKRLGLSQDASTSAIVEYDPAGSSRAFSISPLYTPGSLTVDGPNGPPWSMVWTDGTTAAVVQLNANGSITPKFTVASSKLPAQYSLVRYAKFGTNGIVWLLSDEVTHTRITQWVLGSHRTTHISLPVHGYPGGAALTTAPDGSAWVIAQEMYGPEHGPTHFYRVTPAGDVTTYAVPALNSRNTSPATIFWANGFVWGVATTDFGPDVGNAYLLRVDPSGTVTQAAVANARGAIAEVGPSIAGPGDEAFLSGSSGALPELHFAP